MTWRGRGRRGAGPVRRTAGRRREAARGERPRRRTAGGPAQSGLRQRAVGIATAERSPEGLECPGPDGVGCRRGGREPAVTQFRCAVGRGDDREPGRAGNSGEELPLGQEPDLPRSSGSRRFVLCHDAGAREGSSQRVRRCVHAVVQPDRFPDGAEGEHAVAGATGSMGDKPDVGSWRGDEPGEGAPTATGLGDLPSGRGVGHEVEGARREDGTGLCGRSVGQGEGAGVAAPRRVVGDPQVGVERGGPRGRAASVGDGDLEAGAGRTGCHRWRHGLQDGRERARRHDTQGGARLTFIGGRRARGVRRDEHERQRAQQEEHGRGRDPPPAGVRRSGAVLGHRRDLQLGNNRCPRGGGPGDGVRTGGTRSGPAISPQLATSADEVRVVEGRGRPRRPPPSVPTPSRWCPRTVPGRGARRAPSKRSATVTTRQRRPGRRARWYLRTNCWCWWWLVVSD